MQNIRTLQLLAFACSLASMGAGAQTSKGQGAIVGEATLVIGGAQLWAEDGSARAVERGTPVRVGDRLETAAGGHVHLRFVDGGRLSIRPTSRLQVESYSHTPGQPQLGAIKFRLDEGVARSITGAWGEAARERFRLNTPVAAIGVKGTDFIVRADADTTAATVYSGAIALTPLASGCGATVGPCINGHERMLSADMQGQMLELTRSQAAPTLVAVAEPVANSLGRVARLERGNVSVAASGESVTIAAAPRPSESAVAEAPSAKVLGTESNTATLVAYVPPAPPPEVTPPAPPPVEPPVAQPPPAPPPPPAVVEPPAPVLPPQVTQMAWARYAWSPKGTADDFSYTAGEALQSGLEKVASTLSYVLYRAPTDPVSMAGAWATQVTAAPVVDFRLANASATLSPGNFKPVQDVSVLDGTLQVDFARSVFGTRLNVENPTIGFHQISATGNVAPDGKFHATSSNANIAGGLSGNLQDAGYTFEKALPAGVLTGITLWGR